MLLKNGRVRLGVQNCKAQLRAGITKADTDRGDNLVIAIGGMTAKDGLRDRLAWAGVPVEKLPNGRVDCDRGFFLMAAGPLEWRTAFPELAAWVDTVTQGHRVGRLVRLPGERQTKTNVKIAAELIRLYHWGLNRAGDAPEQAEGEIGPGCPPHRSVLVSPVCPTDCPPKKRVC